MSDPRPTFEEPNPEVNYDCKFVGTKSNGHWHTTMVQANECINDWKRWNSVKPTEQLSFSHKPHGTGARDHSNQGIN